MAQEWRERVRPVRLEKRYEFPDYATLRDFLDLAAELSEKEDMYPEELDQAIEILEELVKRAPEGLVV